MHEKIRYLDLNKNSAICKSTESILVFYHFPSSLCVNLMFFSSSQHVNQICTFFVFGFCKNTFLFSLNRNAFFFEKLVPNNHKARFYLMFAINSHYFFFIFFFMRNFFFHVFMHRTFITSYIVLLKNKSRFDCVSHRKLRLQQKKITLQ